MAKLNEISYDIREALKEFSDDSELDSRHLIHLINTKRAKYLRQDLNNFQKATDLSIQQSLCLELEEVSADECSVDSYCDKLIRTVKPIPKAIELHTKSAITKVKPTNRIAQSFNLINRDKAPYVSSSPYSKSIFAFIDVDNHIYVLSESKAHKLIECISVTGIFENPLLLADYKDCCGCETESSCYDIEESEYPLQPHYIDLIKSEIVNDLLRLKAVPEDKTNDQIDEEQKQN